MKRSEKILASVLLVSVGIFVVMPWIWQAFRGPVAEQESELRMVTEKLDKAIDEFDIARASVKSMTLFKEQSLSSNSAQGALAYQQWLTDLAEIVADWDWSVERKRLDARVDVTAFVDDEPEVGEALRDFIVQVDGGRLPDRCPDAKARPPA